MTYIPQGMITVEHACTKDVSLGVKANIIVSDVNGDDLELVQACYQKEKTIRRAVR